VTLRPSPLTLEITTLVADTGLRALSVYTKFELRRPSRSEDIGHLLCEY